MEGTVAGKQRPALPSRTRSLDVCKVQLQGNGGLLLHVEPDAKRVCRDMRTLGLKQKAEVKGKIKIYFCEEQLANRCRLLVHAHWQIFGGPAVLWVWSGASIRSFKLSCV